MSARELGVAEHSVIKTLVMEDERRQPLLLMHGPPFRLPGRRHVPVWHAQGAAGVRGKSIPELPRIYVNGGKRGYLVGLASAEAIRILHPVLVEAGVPG